MGRTFHNKYEDNIVKVWEMSSGEYSITAEHRHLFRNCPIEYDTSTGKCYIYSDSEVPGLTLVGTNEEKQRNRIIKAEVALLPTKEAE